MTIPSNAACDLIVGDPAIGLVIEGFEQFSTLATTTSNIALTGLQNLFDFTVAPVDFNITWNLDASITGYNRPPVPADIAVAYDDSKIHDPGAPPDTSISPISFVGPPTADLSPPSINLPDGPGDLMAVAPGAPPALAPVVIPAAPSSPLPDVPTLFSLNLPTFAGVTIPTFDGVRPTLNFDVPAQNWSFEPADYMSDLLNATRNQITFGLQGRTGLPLAIEQALFDRAIARDDVSALRAQQDVREARASMGWAEPDGVLDKKLIQITQASLAARANLSRDIYIQVSTVEIENIKFYTTQGISLESKLIDLHLGIQQLLLDSAKFVLQTAIEIFNARVSLFNAQQTAYATDAQVFRDRLQGVLTEVEVYKAQIDAQRLIGEVNQQLVAVYTAQIQAVMASVEIFKAQVEGATAQANANRVVIEAYSATVSAYAEQVRAFGIQWDAYKSQVDAEVSKETIYSTAVSAFAKRVDVWASINNNSIEQQKLVISEKELQLEAWKGLLARFQTEFEAEKARIGAEVSIYEGVIEKYRAEATVETAAADSNARATGLLIEQNKSATDVALKNAQLQSDQLFRLTTIISEIKKAIAMIASQLAGSAMSAVHLAATATHGSSNEQSCQTQVQFQAS